MSLEALMLSEAGAYTLAASRIAGFFLVSPFPGKNTPNKMKIGLVLTLAWVSRSTDGLRPDLALDLTLAGKTISEIGLGILIGFVLRITFSAAEMLGMSISQSMGLTFAQVYDPMLGSEDPIPSRLITILAMFVFLAVGAHRVGIAYVIESFRALPVGHDYVFAAASPALVDLVGRAIEAGVRLSLPVMAVTIAINIVLALVSRASPSLQIFSIGIGLTVAAGTLTFMGAADDTVAGLSAEMGAVGPRIEYVLNGVVSR